MIAIIATASAIAIIAAAAYGFKKPKRLNDIRNYSPNTIDKTEENKISELKKEDEILTKDFEEISISPKNRKERNLSNEVGGVEVDYDKKPSKDQLKDAWDDRGEQISQAATAIENNAHDSENIKSFLFRKKRRRISKKKLDNAAEGGIGADLLNSFVDKVQSKRGFGKDEGMGR